MQKLPSQFIERCRSVTAKRPRTVIEHILKHGHITTEELKQRYGYNHPPRAVRDVREQGIPVETYRVTGSDGRRIAAYRFGDPRRSRFAKLSDRTALSRQIKQALIKAYGCKCFIYLEPMDESDLQIDHRVPFEVAGEGANDVLRIEDFMLLSRSANRAKSWSCEHCENWSDIRNRKMCLTCYWAYPEDYSHVAMRQVRRLDLIWEGADVTTYERLKAEARSLDKEIPQFVKDIIAKELGRRRD